MDSASPCRRAPASGAGRPGVPRYAKESIHAVSLLPTGATLLEDEPGAAALVSERLTFSASEEPIVLDRAYMRGHRISMSTDRLFAGAASGYTLNFGAGVRS